MRRLRSIRNPRKWKASNSTDAEKTPGPSEPSKSLSTEESILSPMEQLKIREKSSQESSESPSLKETPILTPSGSSAIAAGSTSKDPDREDLAGPSELSKPLIDGMPEAVLKNIISPWNQLKLKDSSQKTTDSGEERSSNKEETPGTFPDIFDKDFLTSLRSIAETPGPSAPSTSGQQATGSRLAPTRRFAQLVLRDISLGKLQSRSAARERHQKVLDETMKDLVKSCGDLSRLTSIDRQMVIDAVYWHNFGLEVLGEAHSNRWNASMYFRDTLRTYHRVLEVDDGVVLKNVTVRDETTGNNLCVKSHIDGKDKVVLELTGSFYLACEMETRTIGGDKTCYVINRDKKKKDEDQLPIHVCINVKDKEKFLRRSCTPNAVVKLVKGERGMRWLVKTTKQLNNGAEIVLAFDGDWKESKTELKCATHRGRMGECKMEQSRLNHHRNRMAPEQ